MSAFCHIDVWVSVVTDDHIRSIGTELRDIGMQIKRHDQGNVTGHFTYTT